MPASEWKAPDHSPRVGSSSTRSGSEHPAGFFAYGIRVSWPLATVTIDTGMLRLRSRFVRSVSPYARRHHMSDLVVGRDQIQTMSRHGALLGWGLTLTLSNGSALGLVGPGLPERVATAFDMPAPWQRRPFFWMPVVTRSRNELEDSRDRPGSEATRPDDGPNSVGFGS